MTTSGTTHQAASTPSSRKSGSARPPFVAGKVGLLAIGPPVAEPVQSPESGVAVLILQTRAPHPCGQTSADSARASGRSQIAATLQRHGESTLKCFTSGWRPTGICASRSAWMRSVRLARIAGIRAVSPHSVAIDGTPSERVLRQFIKSDWGRIPSGNRQKDRNFSARRSEYSGEAWGRRSGVSPWRQTGERLQNGGLQCLNAYEWSWPLLVC